MKKISLSLLALLFAGASVMANTPVEHAKKAKTKQATCTSCSKDKCTKKANCPNTAKCVCK